MGSKVKDHCMEYMHSSEDFMDAIYIGGIKVALSSMLMKSARAFPWQK